MKDVSFKRRGMIQDREDDQHDNIPVTFFILSLCETETKSATQRISWWLATKADTEWEFGIRQIQTSIYRMDKQQGLTEQPGSYIQ